MVVPLTIAGLLFTMEDQKQKLDDWGVPLFQEITIFGKYGFDYEDTRSLGNYNVWVPLF